MSSCQSNTNDPPGCLPSYYLWDSTTALADYMKFGSSPYDVFDFPMDASDADDNGVAKAHSIRYQVPKATIVKYPFAQQFHLTIPVLGLTPDDKKQDETSLVASQTGLNPDDVPLALFAGLVHEHLTATIDTSRGAIDEGIQAVKDAIKNAETGDYSGMYTQTVADANAIGNESFAKKDQTYYQVSVEGREFVPVTDGPGWDTALSTVKAAYQNGTSIADALDAVANAGVRPSYFHSMADLHRRNEANVLQAVNDSAFPGYMASLGFGDPNAARLAWLQAAGASVPRTINPVAAKALQALFPRRPLLNVAVLAAAPSSKWKKVAVVGGLLVAVVIGFPYVKRIVS